MINKIMVEGSAIHFEKVNTPGGFDVGVPNEILKDTGINEVFVINEITLVEGANYAQVLKKFLVQYKDYVILFKTSNVAGQKMKDILYATLAGMQNLSFVYPVDDVVYFISNEGVSNDALRKIYANFAGSYVYESLKDKELMGILCKNITDTTVDPESLDILLDALKTFKNCEVREISAFQ